MTDPEDGGPDSTRKAGRAISWLSPMTWQRGSRTAPIRLRGASRPSLTSSMSTAQHGRPMRKAVRQLADQGYVEVVPGKGVFVTRPEERSPRE